MTPTQRELREERTAIMQVEGVPPEEIAKVLARYPQLYGIEDRNEQQGTLI